MGADAMACLLALCACLSGLHALWTLRVSRAIREELDAIARDTPCLTGEYLVHGHRIKCPCSRCERHRLQERLHADLVALRRPPLPIGCRCPACMRAEREFHEAQIRLAAEQRMASTIRSVGYREAADQCPTCGHRASDACGKCEDRELDEASDTAEQADRARFGGSFRSS